MSKRTDSQGIRPHRRDRSEGGELNCTQNIVFETKIETRNLELEILKNSLEVTTFVRNSMNLGFSFKRELFFMI